MEMLELVRTEPARLVIVRGTTTGIPTTELVPGICAVNVLDTTLVGPIESTVLGYTIIVESESVETTLSAVEIPVLVSPVTGVESPAVAPAVCAVGALELVTTEPDEALGVDKTNEADRPAVEPSPCVFEVLLIARGGPVEEEKLKTAGPDVKILGVVISETAGFVGVRIATVRDSVGKVPLVVSLGNVLSMRVDPVVEDSSTLGKTDNVKSKDKEALLPAEPEPVGEETATLGKTGV